MTFRPRRGAYITQRRGRYYYRRMVPESHQELFGKKVIMIPLRGGNDADREKEAHALAARHDGIFQAEVVSDPANYSTRPADTAVMFSDDSDLVFYREGQFVQPEKFAVSHDPAMIRQARENGYFAMSEKEYALQRTLDEHILEYASAENDDRRTIADMKAERIAEQIEKEATSVASETVLSVLDPWRANRKQAPTTWKKHNQYAHEFTDLHTDLPLAEVKKRHVVEYVEHCQKMTYRGEPISPGSIAKRLDSIKALFAYAVSADLILFSPAQGVKPPRDTRPKTSQSWKSFEKTEIQSLITTATDLWSNRRASRNPGRRDDLVAALHCLVWTGARPEEICQLRREDVDLSRKAIIITNDPSDDDARARMVKNDRSTREIPIHNQLLTILGEHVRRSNAPLLFPSFEPQATKAELKAAKESGQPVEIKGRYARPISREWTDYLREKIVPGEPRKVLYSLRHSWAAESRRTGMPEFVRNAIMGHADDNPNAARYGNDADWLEEKRQHLERMICF